jgi:hypothetical protein
VVVATPNARGWEKYLRPGHLKAYHEAWRDRGLNFLTSLSLLLRYDSVFCWDPPRHLYAFTPESLLRVGERLGYSTELRVGTNNDPRFEPRRYVIAAPGKRFDALIRMLAKQPWRLGLSFAIVKLFLEQLLFRMFNSLMPTGGEQLYMVFTKKHKASQTCAEASHYY